jgi:Holliday junction resolvase RusA-like endonuclease
VTVNRVTFFVPGTPIPKARPRVVRSKKGFPITYTPKTTAQWEKTVVKSFNQQCLGIFFERSVPLKFYAEIIMAGTGPLSTIRGDIDNHCKSIFDALNTVAFEDDAQIIELHVKKRRARKGEPTGALVEIEPAVEVQEGLFQPLEKTA